MEPQILFFSGVVVGAVYALISQQLFRWLFWRLTGKGGASRRTKPSASP